MRLKARLGVLAKSTAVRLSALYILLFALCAAFLVFYVTGLAERILNNQTREALRQEITEIQGAFERGGINQLLRTMERRARQPGANLYVIAGPNGEILAGNVASLQPGVFDEEGWTNFPFRYQRYTDSGGVKRHMATGHVFILENGLRVLVGRDLGEPGKLRLLVRQALMVALLIMGVGAGHVEAEFDLLGLPFADRGRLLDESIDALRAAFAEDYPTLPGPVWPAADMGQHPRPVQEDGPPIWVGGSSPAALRRAAQRGDGWLPQGPVTPEIIEQIRALRHEAGRHDAFDFGALVGPVYVGEPDWDLGGPTLAGSPDKIAHVLRKFSAMGVGQAQVRLRSRSLDELVDQIGRFGAEVIPQLG